ncbi:hypothetical protein DHD32_20165 [Arenibacter sp. TNZ]|nr:hypothetical protein [Arenibacter sp. TNZ]
MGRCRHLYKRRNTDNISLSNKVTSNQCVENGLMEKFYGKEIDKVNFVLDLAAGKGYSKLIFLKGIKPMVLFIPILKC